jgi:hypothetical protein
MCAFLKYYNPIFDYIITFHEQIYSYRVVSCDTIIISSSHFERWSGVDLVGYFRQTMTQSTNEAFLNDVSLCTYLHFHSIVYSSEGQHV